MYIAYAPFGKQTHHAIILQEINISLKTGGGYGLKY